MKTYGTLKLVPAPGDVRIDDNGVAVRVKTGRKRWRLSDSPPHVIQALKRIFPRIPKAQKQPFFFPRTDAVAADLEWFMNRYPLLMTATDVAILRQARDEHEIAHDDVENVLADGYVPPVYPGLQPGQEVRPPQAVAVEVLQRSGGLLLGDETGLGKTFVGGAACLAPGNLPAVVVCQADLSGQWVAVLRRFTTLCIHEIRGTKPYALPAADVYVFRYTQLAGWADYFEELAPKLVIWDEIQELRHGEGTPSSPIAKGVAARRLFEVCERSLGLTATPIYNYGAEIWNVLQYINPDVLGPKEDFLREWCVGQEVEDPKALGSFLRDSNVFLRRGKPNRVNKVVHFLDEVYDESEIRALDEIAHDLAVRASSGSWNERGEATRELDLRMRQATGIAKARAVADFVRVIVEGGEPVILAGWHREVYRIWNERLADLRPAMYTGSETPAEKKRQKDRFTSGETDLMFISLRSARGLDGLQFRCGTGIVGELDWSPQVHHQFIGRVDRDGQPRWESGELCDLIYLVVNDGSDPPMMEVNGLKASQSSGIIDPHLGVQTVANDESRLQRLVARYLERRPANAAP